MPEHNVVIKERRFVPNSITIYEGEVNNVQVAIKISRVSIWQAFDKLYKLYPRN